MSDQLDLVAGIAPAQTKRFPSEPIARAAEVEGKCRWTLRRAWGASPCVLWCGLNPSRADAVLDDPTTLREIGFSYRWGYGSLVKINLYPLVTPWPGVLRRWLTAADEQCGFFVPGDGTPLTAIVRNIEIAAREAASAQACVAAWGAVADPERVDDFLSSLSASLGREIEWQCLGTTASGAPIHTLARGRNRVPDDAAPRPWRNPREGRT